MDYNRYFDPYIRSVLSKLRCSRSLKRRIREDLMEALVMRAEDQGIYDPVMLMGEPTVIAAEFSANLGIEQYAIEEYRSETQIFGLPLIHYVKRGMRPAKGIIAVGQVAIGVVSIGGLGIGVFSFGGLSLGVFSLGGLALGVVAALGGMAVGFDFAAGGMAVAYNLAIGGFAVAKDLAIGGKAIAELAIYTESYNSASTFIRASHHISQVTDSLRQAIESNYSWLGPVKKALVRWVLSSI